jgi:putative polyhydroxyalkanoate system protein
MPDIKLHRPHQLGLAKARKVAWAWAEQVEQEFGMACTVLEGDDGDTVEFTRPGVNGRLEVADDHFELHAKLGLLVGAFSKTIEREIEAQLDALLGAPVKAGKAGKAAAPAKAAAKAKAKKA